MKVAVVTGAAKGLGKEFVTFLAKNGYVVVVHFNKSKREVNKTLETIKKSSPQSFKIAADLKDETQVAAMFRIINKEFGRIDLLVNNVGNFLYKEFSKTAIDEFKDVIESNVYSTLYCSREALTLMRNQKSGQIVNVGSAGAERINITKKSTPYFMAKTNVYILTKIMAWEEAKYGVRINMISPVSWKSDIFDPKTLPTGRKAQLKDIINALKFLISEEAYYINGANIEVAGGFIPGLVLGK